MVHVGNPPTLSVHTVLGILSDLPYSDVLLLVLVIPQVTPELGHIPQSEEYVSCVKADIQGFRTVSSVVDDT